MIVQMEHIMKRYNKTVALEDFSLDIREGERLALLGPNGSGKTTAINCLIGLLTYDSGSIRLFGEPLERNLQSIRRRIGIVPQDLAFFPELTVEENIDTFCGLYERKAKRRRPLVEEAIHTVRLEEHRRTRAKKLSGGLKRRLNIACGIAHKPELLLLDEPTVAVDAQTRNFILESILKMNEQGTTLLYTTHYLEEVEQVASRIIIMEKGHSIASGTSDELKAMISTTEKLTVEIVGEKDYTENFQQLSGVSAVHREGGRYTVVFGNHTENIQPFFGLLKALNIAYQSLNIERPSLNDVFLELTGKELRE